MVTSGRLYKSLSTRTIWYIISAWQCTLWHKKMSKAPVWHLSLTFDIHLDNSLTSVVKTVVTLCQRDVKETELFFWRNERFDKLSFDIMLNTITYSFKALSKNPDRRGKHCFSYAARSLIITNFQTSLCHKMSTRCTNTTILIIISLFMAQLHHIYLFWV